MAPLFLRMQSLVPTVRATEAAEMRCSAPDSAEHNALQIFAGHGAYNGIALVETHVPEGRLALEVQRANT